MSVMSVGVTIVVCKLSADDKRALITFLKHCEIGGLDDYGPNLQEKFLASTS